MNPTPAMILAFLGGYLIGHYVGSQAPREEMALTWEELQAEAAREGLQ